MMTDKPKMEPTAEIRTAAVQLRQMFVALVDQEFTEDQALKIIGYAMAGRRDG